MEILDYEKRLVIRDFDALEPLCFSDEENVNLVKVNVNEVLETDLRGQDLDLKKIEKLNRLDSSSLKPIWLGYITEKQAPLYGKLILIDGLHRYASRISGKHLIIHAHVTKFSSLNEIKKELIKKTGNLNSILSKEELFKNVYDFIKVQKIKKEKIIPRSIAREFGLDRDTVRSLECKVFLEEKLTKSQIKVLNSMPISIIRGIYNLKNLKQSEVRLFFNTYEPLLKSITATVENRNKLSSLTKKFVETKQKENIPLEKFLHHEEVTSIINKVEKLLKSDITQKEALNRVLGELQNIKNDLL